MDAVSLDAADRASRSAPRWHIGPEALSVLEAVFKLEQFPNVETRKQLGIDLQVSSRQIQVWFQNRRQRERKNNKSLAQSRSVSSTSLTLGDDASAPVTGAGVFAGENERDIPLALLSQDLKSGLRIPSRVARESLAAGHCGLGLNLTDDLPMGDLPPLGQTLGFDIEPALLTRTGSPSSSTGMTDSMGGSGCTDADPPAVKPVPSFAAIEGANALVAASAAVMAHGGSTAWNAPGRDLLLSSVQSAIDDPAIERDSLFDWSKGPGERFSKARAGGTAFVSSIASQLASSCQATLLGKTLKQYGGIVQVVTEATHPYRVISVSSGWERLCGYTQREAAGKTLKFLQGPATEPVPVAALMKAVRESRPVLVRLTNYTKFGVSYDQQLSVEPLKDPLGVTRCFQATSLIIRPPGDLSLSVDMARELPLISNDAAPPLWPLLARAVRPDSTPQTITSIPPLNLLQMHNTALGGCIADTSSGDLLLAPQLELDEDIMSWLENEQMGDLDAELDFTDLVGDAVPMSI